MEEKTKKVTLILIISIAFLVGFLFFLVYGSATGQAVKITDQQIQKSLNCIDKDKTSQDTNDESIYIASKVISNEKEQKDTCLDKNILQEFFCKNTNSGYSTIICPYGCKEGVCIKNSPFSVNITATTIKDTSIKSKTVNRLKITLDIFSQKDLKNRILLIDIYYDNELKANIYESRSLVKKEKDTIEFTHNVLNINAKKITVKAYVLREWTSEKIEPDATTELKILRGN